MYVLSWGGSVNTKTTDSEKFSDQLQIQLRVIWALIMRETVTRFGREGLGMLWIIGEPAMFVVGVMIVFSFIDTPYVNGVTVAEYMAVSYPTLLFWRNGTGRVTKALEINKALLHHRPIRPIDIIYSRIILEFASAIAVFLFLFPIFVAVGICHIPNNLFVMSLGYLLIIWFSFGFVLIMAALSELSETIEKISHIILYFMLPFSGVFMPLYLVPQPYRDALLYFPLIDAVEYFHHGYFGSQMDTYYNLTYTLGMLLTMTLFGYFLTYLSISKVKAN